MIVSPSILAADFAFLYKDLEMINQSEADWLHVDIMDGVFVPNISFGIPVCQAINKYCKKKLDYHLMIKNPDEYLEVFTALGAHQISVHIEACTHLHRTLEKIKSLGCKAGIAINPHTPAEQLEDIIYMADLILVMSVNPGFGGQKFIPYTLEKIKKLRTMIMRKKLNCLVEIDGGVTLENAEIISNAGAHAVVAGNTVFSSQDPLGTISRLKKL